MILAFVVGLAAGLFLALVILSYGPNIDVSYTDDHPR